jgi:thiamine phosphate synthase YjbQ (UPF0047 family)
MPIPTCADMASALDLLAPAEAGWVHDIEGPDDMPAHVKTMLTGISLHIPVIGGNTRSRQVAVQLRHQAPARPHRREIVLQFVGSRRWFRSASPPAQRFHASSARSYPLAAGS